MTSHRRFRRMFPAAIAAVTLASSVPLAAPAHAAPTRPHQRAHVTPPPGKIPTLLRAEATRGMRVQGTSST